MSQMLGQLAIIGHDDQARGVHIKSSDAMDASRGVFDQIDRPTAPCGVLLRANGALGLVEKVVDLVRRSGVDDHTVQSDFIAADVHQHGQFRTGPTVDRHTPFLDHLLHCAP